jgi:CO/xanthine dehydrogenase Mo-binding subunit
MATPDYQYWLGKDKTDLKAVGKRGVIRRDADDKATAKAIFGRDMKLPGMLYARMLISPYAHAKIKNMDTSEAEKLPGVRAIVRYDDPEIDKNIYVPWTQDVINALNGQVGLASMSGPMYVLGPEAFFEGAPCGVAIAADELDIADEAMELVRVEWEELPFVIDVEKALEPDAPIAYEFMTSYDPKVGMPYWNEMMGPVVEGIVTLEPTGWKEGEKPSNIRTRSIFVLPGSDLDKAFASADKVIEFTFKRTEVNGASGPEVLSTLARWSDNGMLDIWQSTEMNPALDIYASMVGIDKAKFIWHSPYAGGQFGGWDAGFNIQFGQVPVAALLAKRAGRPVKVVDERKDENFGEMDNGVYKCKVGFMNDGKITAVQSEVAVAMCLDMAIIPDTIGTGHLYEATSISNMKGTGTAVLVNKHAFGASRCEQQADAKIKQHVFSRVAAELGTDQGTIYLKNDGMLGQGMDHLSQF